MHHHWRCVLGNFWNLRRISVYLSRDGHQGFDRYAPILCRDYFMYVSCMQGKKKATGVFAYSQSIDPLHRVWRMWTYVYTVCISDCYLKDKCRYRDCTAVSVCDYCIVGCVRKKTKITGIERKYSNCILSARNISGCNPWKFYFPLHI